MGQLGDGVRPRVWPAFVMVSAFALLPYAELLAHNRGEGVDHAVVARAAVVTLALAIVPLALVSRRRPVGTRRAAVFVAYVLWAVFHVEVFRFDLWHESTLAVWLAFAALGAIPLVFLSRRPAVQHAMTVFGVALLIANAAMLALPTGSAAGDESATPGRAAQFDIADDRSVYHFVLDAYGAPDVIADGWGADVSGFTAWLAERGFHVAKDMRANYPWTWLSLSAMLDMQYPLVEGEAIANDDRRPYFEAIGGSNATARTFRAAGYQHIHASPGIYEGSVCTGVEDVCVGGRGGLSETMWAILHMTPVPEMPGIMTAAIDHVATYSDPAAVAREVLDARDTRPVFAFMHILEPHPPYLHRADCSRRPGADLDDNGFGEPRRRYADAVTCLNRRLREAVSVILEADPEAIIILQGDHGPSGYGFDAREPSHYVDRLPVFSAWLLPDGCTATATSTVNTYRQVFDCLAHEDVADLPDKAFLGGYAGQPATPLDVPPPPP